MGKGCADDSKMWWDGMRWVRWGEVRGGGTRWMRCMHIVTV